MTINQLKANKVLRGPIFPEPVQDLVTVQMGDAVRLVEISGTTALLFPVGELARTLFGRDEGEAAPKRKKREPQMDLFKVPGPTHEVGTTFGETKVERHGETVLDRIHQSTILFAAGHGGALKRFLAEGGVGRDQRFWRLAQALSAMYHAQAEEKRWVTVCWPERKGWGFKAEVIPMSLQNQIDAARADIRTDDYSMSIGEWLNLYNDGELDIHPEFQRFYRWDSAQKSRFIESLLLGIPIPPVFVAQRKDGVWDVVDGLQRFIDEKLVQKRNHVAHGQFLDFDASDFEDLLDEVTGMMETWRNDIENACVTKRYRFT